MHEYFDLPRPVVVITAHFVKLNSYTRDPPKNGQVGDEYFIHCSEVVPSSEVEMY